MEQGKNGNLTLAPSRHFKLAAENPYELVSKIHYGSVLLNLELKSELAGKKELQRDLNEAREYVNILYSEMEKNYTITHHMSIELAQARRELNDLRKENNKLKSEIS